MKVKIIAYVNLPNADIFKTPEQRKQINRNTLRIFKQLIRTKFSQALQEKIDRDIDFEVVNTKVIKLK